MKFKIFDMFLGMGLAWAFYGTFNVLLRENRKDRDTPFAMMVIVCFTLQIFDHLLKPLPEWKSILDLLFYFTRNIYYLTGPLLLLYTKSLLHKRHLREMRWPLLFIHALPFILWVVLSFNFPDTLFKFNRIFLKNTSSVTLERGGQGARSIFATVRVIGSFLSPLIYGFFILLDIRKHRESIPRFYSHKNIGNTLSWLSLLVLSFIVLCFVFLLMEIMSIFSVHPPSRNPMTALAVYPVIFIFFFSYFSKEQKIPEDTKVNFIALKYEKSVLRDSEAEAIYTNLLRVVEEEKTYLDPDLTLEKMALKSRTTKHNLSQVINSQTDQNFYSFINNYRIGEFKRLLEENVYPNFTLIALAFECGFSSSSAFYSTFKKVTGVTPRDYIKSLEK